MYVDVPRYAPDRVSLPRPIGHRAPPPPSIADVARTVGVAAAGVVPILARLALHRVMQIPSTTTDEGLFAVAETCRRLLARLAIELVVEGDVPRGDGLVLMWNQASHLDHVVLPPAIPRPFFSLYNNAVAAVPGYGAHMRATGHVHVDARDEAQWRAGVATAARRVREGGCVLVSPEGTRSWDGRLLPMKRGALLLAAESERPIVCATVTGGHACMPRGSAVVRAGTIRVTFSAPIENDGDPASIGRRVAATFQEVLDRG
jgi:1-acyl-sn-glycerol-3-phosphate acyltransferase